MKSIRSCSGLIIRKVWCDNLFSLFRAHPISFLLVIALSLNLLLPFHSDAYFFSLLVGDEIWKSGEFIYENRFTQFGYGRPWGSASPLYDLSLFTLEEKFGMIGLGLFQLIMFMFASFLSLQLLLSPSDSLEKSNKRAPFITLVTLMMLGGVLYGSSLHSGLFFYTAVVLSLLILRKEKSSYLKKAIYFLALSVLIFFDVRAVISPALAVLITCITSSKISRKNFQIALLFQLLFLASSLIIMPIRSALFSILTTVLSYLHLSDVLFFQSLSFNHLSENAIYSFNGGFLLLLMVLGGIKYRSESRKFSFGVLLVLSLWCAFTFVSTISRDLLLLLLAYYLSRPIPEKISDVEEHKLENKESPILRIEKTIDILAQGFNKLSLAGRVFVVLSFSFVQASHFLRAPVSDILMPVRVVDVAIENKRCPKYNDAKVGGYLAYRYLPLNHSFAYERIRCLPLLSEHTLSSLSKRELVEYRVLNRSLKDPESTRITFY